MKRKLLLILAALFLLIAGIQNAMAQNVTLYSEGNKVYECSVSQLDSIVFSEAPTTIETEEIVVTIDANGNADDEHLFTKIDESNFYIDDIKYTANQGVLSVTGYNASFFRGEAKIINTLVYQGRKLKVTSIGKEAFKGCKVLTSVVIPNSVTSIGESAFHSCSGLTSVTIPNSVTSIGSFAFYGCSSLTSVTLNSETIVSSSRMSAIFGNQVKTYIIGSDVTSIGEWAFSDCSGLTSITIPESVTSIGYSAFNSCTSLTSVTLESDAIVSASRTSSTSMKSIFGGQVKTYIIGDAVKSIGNYAFSGCSSLKDVYCLAESVPQTASFAFDNSPISSATLHVPAGSVNAYKNKFPWASFGTIVAIE